MSTPHIHDVIEHEHNHGFCNEELNCFQCLRDEIKTLREKVAQLKQTQPHPPPYPAKPEVSSSGRNPDGSATGWREQLGC